MTSPQNTMLAATDKVIAGQASESGVAWSAIFAGALAAAVVSLVLLVLGAGLGLSVVSPWTAVGADASTLAISAIVWLILMQIVSSGFGGYFAGRLRRRWAGISRDESYFRDTAHGFFAWALATVVVVTMAGSGVSSLTGAGASAVGSTVTGVAHGVSQGAAARSDATSMPTDYFVDLFFRPASQDGVARSPEVNSVEARSEVSRILAVSLATGSISAPDKAQLTGLVAARLSIPPADAERRVDDVLLRFEAFKTEVTQSVDTGRKAGAVVSLVAVLSLLIGAFVASAAACWGGQHRDGLA